MKKELAQHLAYILRHCSGLLDHTVWLMKRHGTEAEFLQHRNMVAQVLGELGIQLLYPIWRKYPDLEPALPPSSVDQEEPSSKKSPQGENQMGKDVLTGKELAQQFALIYQYCSGLLNHIVWLTKHQGTEAEFLRLKRAVEEVLTDLGSKLLDPIYAKYPDLAPSPPTPKGGDGGQFSEK